MRKMLKALLIFFCFQIALLSTNANPPVPTQTKQQTQQKTIQTQQTTVQKTVQQTKTTPTVKQNNTSTQPPISYPKISVPIRNDLIINGTQNNVQSIQKENTTPITKTPLVDTKTQVPKTNKKVIVIEEDEDNTDEIKIKSDKITNEKNNTKTTTKENVLIQPQKIENQLKEISNTREIQDKKIEKPEEKETITQDKADAYAEIRDNARVLYNSGKAKEAKNEFSKIPDAEKISEDWLFLGNIAIDETKPVDAVFYYKKAIQADEDNYKAYFNLGNLYFADNKINMALESYRKVLKINKNYAYAHYNKGCCYLKNKSYINARYEFGLAIRSNPHEPAFYYNLAYTNKMMGKEKKAKEALDIYNSLMNE